MNQPELFYRPINRADEAFLWEMLYQAIFVPPGQPGLPREIMREPGIAIYVEHWGRRGDQGWVAVDRSADCPVGAAWIRTFTEAQHGYGYVNDQTPELSIAVLPAYRQLGIGSMLLDLLIRDASKVYPAICLSVSADNPAVKLYLRFGFETIAQTGQSLTMTKEFGEKSDKIP